MHFKKIKPFLILAFLIAFIVSPFFIAASLKKDVNYGSNWGFGNREDHRNISIYKTSSTGSNPFYDKDMEFRSQEGYSVDDSTVLSVYSNSLKIGLFWKQPLGRDTYELETQDKNIDGDNFQGTIVNAKPFRESALRFSMAKAITLEYNDISHTKKVFDNDWSEFEKEKYLTENPGKNEQDFINLMKKSINGKEIVNSFGLPGLIKVIFLIKDDVKNHYWIKGEDGKKGPSLSIEDIWTGTQRTIWTNILDRFSEEGGIISGLNNFMSTIFPQYSTFSDPQSITPSNFFKLQTQKLDFNYEKFKNHNETVQGNNFVLNFNGHGKSHNLEDFWNSMIISNWNLFSAFPTFEVANAIKKYENIFKNGYYIEPNSGKKIEIKKDEKKDNREYSFEKFSQSKAYKFGILQENFLKWNEHYVASQYYISKNERKKLVAHINENFIDHRWINQRNKNGDFTTIKTYTTNFLQDSELSKKILVNTYKQGINVSSVKNNFTTEEWNKILSNPKKWGLDFGVGFNNSKMMGDYTFLQLMPLLSNPVTNTNKNTNIQDQEGKFENIVDKVVDGNKNGNVYYNDNFAKVMWGHTIAEMHNDVLGSKDWVKNIAIGSGLAFRTNLNAAINEFVIAKNFSLDREEWTTIFASEGKVVGKDHRVILPSKPLDAPHDLQNDVESLRSKFAIPWNSQNHDSDLQNILEVKRSNYEKQYSSSGISSINRYGPSVELLTQIKTNIKKILDDVGIKQNEKVIWEFPIGRGMTYINNNVIYKELQEFINSLDQRLNVVAKVHPAKEDGTQKVKVETQNYTKDFKLEDIPGNKLWIDRIHQAGNGYNIASLNVVGSYLNHSPAYPMLFNSGYLQTGFLQTMSYYFAHQNIIRGTKLENLNIINDSLNESLTNMQTELNKKGSSIFESSKKQEIFDDLINFKFENIWKSSMKNLADYDYLGFYGLDKILEIRKSKDYFLNAHPVDPVNKNHNLEVKKIKSDIKKAMVLITSWLHDSIYNLQEKFEYKLDTKDILKTMTAFNIIAPPNMNAFLTLITNRSFPIELIKKSWYSTSTDSNFTLNIAWFNVDLDKK